MPTIGHFEFMRSTPIYYSGEKISGRIFLTTTKNKLPLEAIKLKLMGHCHVQWTEKCPSLDIDHNDSAEEENTVRYYGSVECHNESIKLADNVTLRPGTTFSYNFHFTVPEQSLATCVQKYGEVAYVLNLVLKRKSTFNKIYKQRVVIKNKLDLNAESKLIESTSATSGHVSEATYESEFFQFSLPCTGFVPAQLIRYRLELGKLLYFNQVLVNLCQRIVYKSLLPIEKIKETVTTLSCGHHRNVTHSTRQIKDGILKIPLSVPISSTDAKSLIQVSYYLEALVANERNQIVKRLVQPITIGTTLLKPSTIFGQDNDVFSYDNLGSIAAPNVVINEMSIAVPVSNVNKKEPATSEMMPSSGICTQICDQIILLPLHDKAHFRNV